VLLAVLLRLSNTNFAHFSYRSSIPSSVSYPVLALRLHMSKKAPSFIRAKIGRNATNIGASYDLAAFSPEPVKNFYDDGIIAPPYPDDQRCKLVRSVRYGNVAPRRCGQLRLIGELCFFHANKEEQIKYQLKKKAEKQAKLTLKS